MRKPGDFKTKIGKTPSGKDYHAFRGTNNKGEIHKMTSIGNKTQKDVKTKMTGDIYNTNKGTTKARSKMGTTPSGKGYHSIRYSHGGKSTRLYSQEGETIKETREGKTTKSKK